MGLNDTLDQVDLSCISSKNGRVCVCVCVCAHGAFSRIVHILGHKSSTGKFLKIKIISNIFSDHNAIRLDINYRGKQTNKNTWRLNNTLLNKQGVTDEVKDEIKKYLEGNDNENTTTQDLWDALKAVLGGNFIAI